MSTFFIVLIAIVVLTGIVKLSSKDPILAGTAVFLLSITLFIYTSSKINGVSDFFPLISGFFSLIISIAAAVFSTKVFEKLAPPIVSTEKLADPQALSKNQKLSTSEAKKIHELLDFDLGGPPENQDPASKQVTRIVEIEPDDYFEYEDYSYHDGHTEDEWQRIGLKVNRKHYSYNRSYYSFKETEPKSYSQFDGLSPNQRKVKILGSALVSKTGSKRRAKDILVDYYNFPENTAKYATGYSGFHDW